MSGRDWFVAFDGSLDGQDALLAGTPHLVCFQDVANIAQDTDEFKATVTTKTGKVLKVMLKEEGVNNFDAVARRLSEVTYANLTPKVKFVDCEKPVEVVLAELRR